MTELPPVLPIDTRPPAILPLVAVVLLILTPATPALAQATHTSGPVDAFWETYRTAPEEERSALWGEFVTEQDRRGGFPVVGDGEVTFFYRAAEEDGDAFVVGDFALVTPYEFGWEPRGLALEPVVAGDPLRTATLAVPATARLDYALDVQRDGEGERIRDPLNPRSLLSGVGGGEVSELVMPAYRAHPVLAAEDEPPRGALEVLDEPWASPRVTVYLPPGYDPEGAYPTVYTADGGAWQEYLQLPATLDALLAAGRIEPVVAVMIDSRENRRRWYYYNPEYLTYLERVVAAVDARYATRPDPEARVHAGTSSGARAALYAALERPDLFHKVAALSPALNGPPSYWRPFFATEVPPAPLELWVSTGAYEGVVVEDAALLADLFRRWDLPVVHTVTDEGHSFGAWRNHAPHFLEHFFPPR